MERTNFKSPILDCKIDFFNTYVLFIYLTRMMIDDNYIFVDLLLFVINSIFENLSITLCVTHSNSLLNHNNKWLMSK